MRPLMPELSCKSPSPTDTEAVSRYSAASHVYNTVYVYYIIYVHTILKFDRQIYILCTYVNAKNTEDIIIIVVRFPVCECSVHASSFWW